MSKPAADSLPAPLTAVQERIAMTSPEHMKMWLRESGRDYIVFRSDDLIDSLSWPTGVTTFMQVVDAYRAYRREQPVSLVPCPKCEMAYRRSPARIDLGTCMLCANTGEVVERAKTDVLEPDEIDAAIAHLQRLKSSML